MFNKIISTNSLTKYIQDTTEKCFSDELQILKKISDIIKVIIILFYIFLIILRYQITQ